MKSLERCKSTFQGDRCKRDRGHETATDNPNVHVGQFTMWNENGVVLLKVQGSQSRRRSRVHNRAVRNLSSLPLKTLHPAIRTELQNHVGALIAHFGGNVHPSGAGRG